MIQTKSFAYIISRENNSNVSYFIRSFILSSRHHVLTTTITHLF